jgi:primosomal protein N' (replication factor Y)
MSGWQPVGADAFVTVLVEGGPPRPLTYRIPPALKVRPGARVEVSVRGKPHLGTIAQLESESSYPRTLSINGCLPETEWIAPDLWQLATWMAGYYATPLAQVIRCVTPPSVRRQTKAKQQLFVRPLMTREQLRQLCVDKRQQAPAQARTLDHILKVTGGIFLTELLEKAGTSRSVVDALKEQQAVAVEAVEVDRSPLQGQEYFATEPKTLNPEQGEALAKIKASERFATHLLAGITGSGKTEVYLQAIAAMLERDKGAIMLLPEIALTTQMIERFRSRFQDQIAVLHHRLSDGERIDEWRRIQKREARVVLGARSAVFSPVPSLGLIIVDEEHEQSYKQSEMRPCYHARNVAVMRGKLTDSVVILGSATPSLESFYNTEQGKYTLSRLSNRADACRLPTVKIIDLKKTYEKAKGFTLFSDELLEGIKARYAVGEQTILFLNRRGYAAMQWCAACQQAARCKHCDLSLTFHRGTNVLACHLCGYTVSPLPKICLNCGESDPVKLRGAGTEQVERALAAVLPDVRRLRIDADTTRHKGSLEKLLRQFRTGRADVLIGTQMIAKGLHFPQVTLVGVLNSDTSLNIPDFRASEQVFQLLTQVAGRAGRGATPGEVIIQTMMPDNPVIQLAAKQDFDHFYQREIEGRKLFDYPPFSHLIKLTFAAEEAAAAQQCAEALHAAICQGLTPPHQAMPVAPSGYAKVKDSFRFQILLKGPSVAHMNQQLERALSQVRLPRPVRFSIDVDPTSTFF